MYYFRWLEREASTREKTRSESKGGFPFRDEVWSRDNCTKNGNQRIETKAAGIRRWVAAEFNQNHWAPGSKAESSVSNFFHLNAFVDVYVYNVSKAGLQQQEELRKELESGEQEDLEEERKANASLEKEVAVLRESLESAQQRERTNKGHQTLLQLQSLILQRSVSLVLFSS